MNYGAIAWWLGCRFTKAGMPSSKPYVGLKTTSAIHPANINLMSTKNFWRLLVKISPHGDSAALRQWNPIHKMLH